MRPRGTAAGLLAAEKQSRRVRAYKLMARLPAKPDVDVNRPDAKANEVAGESRAA